MATDFTTDVTSFPGGLTPDTYNTPLDIRTRVETEEDILDIPKPYLGMIVYVIDTGKRFEITGLKDKKVGMSIKKNAIVDTYAELFDTSNFATKDDIERIDEDLDALGDADVFKADNATASSIGGIAAGDNLDGLTMQELLTKLLYPYVAPTVSADIICTPQDVILEKGYSVTVSKMNATVVKGSEDISKVSFIIDGTEIASITEDVASGGTFECAFNEAVVLQSDIDKNYFKVEVIDASNNMVDAEVKAINFVYPFYFGVVDENVEVTGNMINGFEKVVDIKSDKSYCYTTDNQHMAIAYPKEYGNLSKITDTNGFNLLATFDVQEVDVTGFDGTSQTYYIYKNGASTVSNYEIIFKF